MDIVKLKPFDFAQAVAKGFLASGDPRCWRMVGGRLYLTFDARAQARWDANATALIARAHRNWPAVLR